MQGQSEARKPLAQHRHDTPRILLVLETNDESSSGGESHPSALTGPEVKLSPHRLLRFSLWSHAELSQAEQVRIPSRNGA